jgi:TPR repeat protein
MKLTTTKPLSVSAYKRLVQAGKIAPMGIVAMVDRLAYGEGVKSDKRKAFLIAMLGAKLDSPYLTWYVADAFEHGEGVEKSRLHALQYYKKAIALNGLEAYTGLGVYLWKKARSTRDRKRAFAFYKEAISLYRKAARKHEPYAILNIGLCYANGEGVRVNKKIAYRYFAKSAALGHVDAMFKVGWCLMYGEGVATDVQLAAHWLQIAADLGHKDARKLLRIERAKTV